MMTFLKSCITFIVIFLVMAFIKPTIVNALAFPNDTFDGKIIEKSCRWLLYGNATVTQDERLIISTKSNASSSGSTLVTMYEFPENFDVQVDFELGAGWSSPLSGHSDGAVLGVSFGDVTYHITRVRFPENAWWPSDGKDQLWIWKSGGARPAYINSNAIIGKYRIIRNGTTLTFQYDFGSGWQVLTSVVAPLGNARIYINAGSINAWHAFTSYFDNFIVNSGKTTPASCPIETNEPPTANAGVDQTLNEGDMVILDGSGSSDPDGDPLTYQWLQTAGMPVSLNLTDPVHPIFAGPSIPIGGTTLTFQLTVNDGQLTSSPAIVNVSVKNVNHAPTSNAGNDQIVAEAAPVQLDGSGSYDPDGEGLVYQWYQTAGPLVQLSDPTAVTPSFTAPIVGSTGATLTFELTVSDGIDDSYDTVYVFVENVNHAPLANAGIDQTKDEGTFVVLDGIASSDPDMDALSFDWSQISGQPVILSDYHSANPSFTAPLVALGGETLVFQLIVNDGLAESVPVQVNINILNINDSPACGFARAIPAILWPPNHKMASVNISGVVDPNNDNVTVKVIKVTQDEPVNGLGDGDTSPDAVLQDESVLLRTERLGNGNGRVYHVYFTADDGQGGVCNGSVKVSVPHSKNSGNIDIDDGQLYDSTQP